MNISKFFIAVLTSITFSFNAAATLPTIIDNDITVEAKKVEGGPRTVIQAMTEVVVLQPTANNLYITILNSDGQLMAKATTSAQEVTFSTEEWNAGTYKIETTDDSQEYQEFYINVE
ncbi:T9SS type A sorting domain-containing protein [Aureispira sp. CCB-E]|uniref:T9SS type A sorting domain-containing protein n=1 Tax=Aureispira sp. CCB-E TaxID=3051121 RepID=UPI0028695011|nr:T9SS type A sorting domain-containing protein [Aureispira sp. CCB-E]WMX13467.1 T9SS type A sorting domain-containing protein [Aureispira sp. CCB-E]